MSSEALAWVVRYGMQELPSRLVGLTVLLADEADKDGEGAIAWVSDRKIRGDVRPGLATLCGVSVRMARLRLAELEERAVIARGNQRLVEWVRADRRPVVWDLPGVKAAYRARSSGVFRG